MGSKAKKNGWLLLNDSCFTFNSTHVLDAWPRHNESTDKRMPGNWTEFCVWISTKNLICSNWPHEEYGMSHELLLHREMVHSRRTILMFGISNIICCCCCCVMQNSLPTNTVVKVSKRSVVIVGFGEGRILIFVDCDDVKTLHRIENGKVLMLNFRISNSLFLIRCAVSVFENEIFTHSHKKFHFSASHHHTAIW